MIIIGLTGSIGIGKSTVARMMEEMGIPFHDADAAVHRAMAPYGHAVERIADAFTDAPDIVETTPEDNISFINRQKLGQIVFNNADKMKVLEEILHPLARESSDEFIEKCRSEGKEFAVLDIPLLFETGGQDRVDVVFCVSAGPDVQKARVLARPGMTEEKFHQILSRQMPDREKRRLADYVILTDVSLAQTRNQLISIINTLREAHT